MFSEEGTSLTTKIFILASEKLVKKIKKKNYLKQQNFVYFCASASQVRVILIYFFSNLKLQL